MYLLEIKDAEGRLGYWKEAVTRGLWHDKAYIATIVEATRYSDKAQAEAVAKEVAATLTAERGETITVELYQFAG